MPTHYRSRGASTARPRAAGRAQPRASAASAAQRQPAPSAQAQPTLRDASGRGRTATRSAHPQPSLGGRLGASAAPLELNAAARLTGGDASFFGALLTVVGAEHLTLHETLTLWQREQDRLVNRAWRRPGGLARPAGV